ncbi:nucleotidyltransferase [Granulicatella elegans]|uniref:nucleotidyltransferase n=1 Tax=Granulicatella elegans TaxID=137732 RepID=UPI001D158FBF|nr:nucleotidyltransferase [Granulicatella elegans]UEA30857.1 nucleotidyltransferase [Granulicatella elegans]
MKACGIIAEYNPFHKGHHYQIEQIRKQTDVDVIVITMSGNFVQRGEPAIENKWHRAKMALENGADLVLELPTLSSTQATDWFAAGGVGILHAAKCQEIAFGVEDTSVDYQVAFEEWGTLQTRIKEDVTDDEMKSLTYANRLSLISKETFGENSPLYRLMQQPNQQLGFAYVKEILSHNLPMEFITIERIGNGHLDEKIQEGQFASGTALRKQLLKVDRNHQLLSQLPYLEEVFSDEYRNNWEQYWALLKYQLERSSVEELRMIYQMDEGMEYRFKKFLLQANSFDEFIQLLKNKRWTWARLQRLCIYVLLGITKEQVKQHFETIHSPKEVTVLGFNETGREYLKTLREEETNFITNYANPVLELQKKFDNIYDIMNPSGYHSARQSMPVMK